MRRSVLSRITPGQALGRRLRAVARRVLGRTATRRIYLDAPAHGARVFTISPTIVSGWVLPSNGAVQKAEVFVDGQLLGDATPNLARPDVAAAFSTEAAASRSGFEGWFRFTEIEPGEHELSVVATDEAGHEERVVRSIVVYDATGLAADMNGLPPGLRGTTLLFLHIQKTAGTSIRDLLEPRIPTPYRLYLYPAPSGLPVPDFLALPAPDRERLRFVMGHFRFGLHEAFAGPVRYVTMLRHPVDRVASEYFHVTRYPRTERQKQMARDFVSIADFVRDPTLVLDNTMVRLISGIRRPPGRCDDSMLQVAIENVEQSFDAVMIMEDMATSMKLLEHVLGTSLGRPPRMNARSRSADSPLTPSIRSEIEAANPLDLALYKWARERLARQVL